MHFKHTSTRYMQRNSLWLSDYILKCQTACCYLRTCNSILSQGIRGQLILHKTGFPCWKFVTSNFVEVQVFSRIFTFYIVFDNLFLNWLSTGVYMISNTWKSSASIPQKLHYCQRAKTRWTWRIRSVVAENNSMLKSRLSCIQWKFTTPDQSAVLIKILHFFLPLKYSPVSKW